MRAIRIGTRGSQLALKQAALGAGFFTGRGWKAELVTIVTLGDRKQGTIKAESGDKKDWILEIEQAVAKGDVDLAIHSGKDVPADIEEATELLPLGKRADARDAFISREGLRRGMHAAFRSLPAGAKIGTSSLRRRAQLLRLRPDLMVGPVRGNVSTRLDKLRSSPELDGIILAEAGLDRLGLAETPREPLSTAEMMPAMNQGILVVQFRKDRSDIQSAVRELLDGSTHAAWVAERECIEILGADCSSAVAVFGESAGSGVFKLGARVLSRDGALCLEEFREGSAGDAQKLGKEIAVALLDRGAAEILKNNSDGAVSGN